MRLSAQHITAIRAAIGSIASDVTAIRLFGSRLNDEMRGGDVDLMVDVVLRAPNLTQTSIHRIALEEGELI